MTITETTERHPPRLLWVDDQISGLQPYLEALVNAGFNVVPAATPKEALQECKTQTFDIVLCDIWMEPIDGVELLRQIHPYQPSARLCALSSYLYLDRFRDELRSLDFRVQLIDKDMPNTEDPDFSDRFLEPIWHVFSEGVTHTIQDQDTRHQQPAVDDDPFKMPLSEFLKKPILDKDRLVRRAHELAQSTIDRAFREGNIWVLLYGDRSLVRAGAKRAEDILTEEQIMEHARRQHRAPFQFFKPVSSDDMWSDCSEDNTFNYPTVTLLFPNGELDVHFDTGAPMTFFSYEDLVQLEAIRPVMSGFGIAYRGSLDYMATPLRVQVLLKCQLQGGTRLVTLTGQAVRDWPSAPYARQCGTTCQYRIKELPLQLCRGRKGLVGRNLLTENRLTVILDGVARKTGARSEKKR